MIHKFSVQNYKSLKIDNNIKLSPLTILTGINNIGKTTFIKSILEIGRYSQKNRQDLLYSNLPLLSDYKTKVFNYEVDKNIEFNLQIDLEKNSSIEITIKFKYDDVLKSAFISYCEIINNTEYINSLLRISKNSPSEPYCIYSDLGLTLLFGKIKPNTTLPKVFEGYGDFEFIGFLPFQCKLSFLENKILNNWFTDDGNEKGVSLSVKAADLFLDSLINVKYIGPLRNSPKEYYFFENRGLEIDSKGENTFEVLDYYKNRQINFYKNLTSEQLEKVSLLDAVKYWLDFFYEGTTLKLDSINDNLLQVYINDYTINNSGFGFSQLIPIIVQSLLLKKNDLLLLEQPEIHLHPELEYKLAYFLLCIVKNDRQIIAETHSEHIINKLIMSKVDDISNQDLYKVYFLEKENNTTVFNEISISEYGEVENWPDGFFDQYLKFTKDLVIKRKEIALKKMKSNLEH